MERQSKIVYCYNWKNLIFIKRDEEGKWGYSYMLTPLLEFITNDNGIKYNFNDMDDVLDLGEIIGTIVQVLVHKCKKSYGDI